MILNLDHTQVAIVQLALLDRMRWCEDKAHQAESRGNQDERRRWEERSSEAEKLSQLLALSEVAA